MGNAPDELNFKPRTEDFRNHVLEFRDAVDELLRAAEELEGSGIHFDDPLTDKPKRVDFTDLFDLEISINIKPNNENNK